MEEGSRKDRADEVWSASMLQQVALGRSRDIHSFGIVQVGKKMCGMEDECASGGEVDQVHS